MSTDPVEPEILRQRQQVGDRVRHLRDWFNIRQEALAERAGIDSKTVSRVENAVGAYEIDQVFRIANGLGVPVAWLFTEYWPVPSERLPGPDDPSTVEAPGA